MRASSQSRETCLQIAVIGREAGAELVGGLAVSARDVPPAPGANGTLMARRAVAGITGDLRITSVSRALPLSRASKPALTSGSQIAAGGGRWLLMAVRGHLGGTPVMGRPGARRSGAVARPSVFQAWQACRSSQSRQRSRMPLVLQPHSRIAGRERAGQGVGKRSVATKIVDVVAGHGRVSSKVRL